MAVQYYSTQNALTRPIFRIEQTKSLGFSDFSGDGWTFPLGPEDICKEISVYNDGALVKNVEVSVETYLMTCFYMLTTNKTFQGTVMFVPVKKFYNFSQNGKVRGLIASGKSSKFQEMVMT